MLTFELSSRFPETTLLLTLNLRQSLFSRSRDTVSTVALTVQNSQPIPGSKIVMQWYSKKSLVLFSQCSNFLQRAWHRLQNTEYVLQLVTAENREFKQRRF